MSQIKEKNARLSDRVCKCEQFANRSKERRHEQTNVFCRSYGRTCGAVMSLSKLSDLKKDAPLLEQHDDPRLRRQMM